MRFNTSFTIAEQMWYRSNRYTSNYHG
jgi:hypothetical protein